MRLFIIYNQFLKDRLMFLCEMCTLATTAVCFCRESGFFFLNLEAKNITYWKQSACVTWMDMLLRCWFNDIEMVYLLSVGVIGDKSISRFCLVKCCSVCSPVVLVGFLNVWSWLHSGRECWCRMPSWTSVQYSFLNKRLKIDSCQFAEIESVRVPFLTECVSGCCCMLISFKH